jgi:hypothetical protein
MLNFFPPGMAFSYFVCCTVAAFGVIQATATRSGNNLLSWWPRQRGPVGAVIGVVLTAGSLWWFMTSYRHLIYRPGLAGAELVVIFATASGMALTLSRLGTSLTRRGP